MLSKEWMEGPAVRTAEQTENTLWLLIIACCVLQSNDFLIPPHKLKLIWTNSSFFSIAEVELLCCWAANNYFHFCFFFSLRLHCFWKHIQLCYDTSQLVKWLQVRCKITSILKITNATNSALSLLCMPVCKAVGSVVTSILQNKF